MLDNPESLRDLCRRALQWPGPDATRRIAAACEELLGCQSDAAGGNLRADPIIANRQE